MLKIIPRIDSYLKLLDEQKYLMWLSELKEGDYVLYQKFQPKNEFPIIELWQYYWLKIASNENNGQTIVAHGHIGNQNHSHQFINVNSKDNLRDCFSRRLVPLVEDLLPPFHKDQFKEFNNPPSFCTEPLYEPGWRGQRHYLLQKLPRQDDIWRKEERSLKKAFPHTYSFDVTNGELFIVFPGEEFNSFKHLKTNRLEQFLSDNGYQTFHYLYSEPLNY